MEAVIKERELHSSIDLLRLWAPLSVMWILMALEGPLLHSFIARAPEPVFGLATYGYSFYSLLIFEAPVFLFLSASNALIRDRASYSLFKKHALCISVFLSSLLLILLGTGVYDWFNTAVVGLPSDFSAESVRCLYVLSPIPLFVGYRRVIQGILVRARKSKAIALGSSLRIVTAFLVCLFLLVTGYVSGGVLAASAMTICVIVECMFIRCMAHRTIKILMETTTTEEPLTVKKFYSFYIPLALSSFVIIGTQPILSFFIAQSPESEKSLAVWPVLMSFQFLFMSLSLGIADLIIAHYEEHPRHPMLFRQFGLIIALFVTLLFVSIVCTPLYSLWFGSVMNLSRELTDFMKLPAYAMALLPASVVWLTWIRGQLTRIGKTSGVTVGSGWELLTVCMFAFMLPGIFSELSGALLGIIAVTIARIGACIIMACYLRVQLRNRDATR